jgi:Outer membrane protein beta-barrel domain
MNLLRKCLFLSALVPFGAVVANAQSEVDVTLGLGTAQAPSNGQVIDPLGTGVLSPTGGMNGLFMKIGGDVMFKQTLGFGAEVSLRPSQGNYAGLGYRPTFYDFNAVYKPSFKFKRLVPEFQGGLGVANVKFYANQQFCNSLSGCSNSNTLLTGSNHFEVHFAGGLRYYLSDHVFVRPEFDGRWVDNFFQFGRDFVPQYGASFGYTFGER